MLVLDQSGSVTTAFGDTTRWLAMGETLLDPASGLVPLLEANIRFGLQMYAGGDPCPSVHGVPPALNNYQNINDTFYANEPLSQTPTGEALLEVIEIVKADPSEYEKIIVLATDGLPDTCARPNPDEGQPEAIAAAQASFDADIPLFIISVGDEMGEEHLQDMANAGQGVPVSERPGAQAYLAYEPEALADAFWDIILGTRACVLTLEGEVVEDLVHECVVSVDDKPLEKDAENGWRLNNTSEVEILGTTCEGILDGTLSNIGVTCPCGVIIN
jgi:hypothetical protein